jgi:arylformamidase
VPLTCRRLCGIRSNFSRPSKEHDLRREKRFFCGRSWKERVLKVIDISVSLGTGSPVWPGDPDILLEQYRSLSGGDASNDSRIACSVHAGTHVDAPAHFIENGATVDQLPMDVLMGDAAVVELPDVDIITPELLAGLGLPAGTERLLFKTKNSTLWRDPRHDFHPDFAALSTDAAAWVVRQGIRLVGVDYLSVQLYGDAGPDTHRILLEAGVVILEGLDLRNARQGSYRLICLPLKLAGSEAAPARAVLIEP